MRTKQDKIEQFDPSGIGLDNGQFIGLPFDEGDAVVVLLPIPWDVTVSYLAGTSRAGSNILRASTQLDLEDPYLHHAWRMGLFMRSPDQAWLEKNDQLRLKSATYIEQLEQGKTPDSQPEMAANLAEINAGCAALKTYVYETTKSILSKGQLVGLVGGEHSVPLGYLEALAERYPDFGILQIDAHMDLRQAYEGFTYSHASIFHNALALPQVKKLVQVGIRDYCAAELDVIQEQHGRVQVFYDHMLKEAQFSGHSYHSLCEAIVDALPQQVYLSFDIDGLDPSLCPHTGTPVPGGLQFQEALHLIKVLVDSGRQIIGFDLCEVNGEHEWDGNVGARLLYRLANLMGRSQGKI